MTEKLGIIHALRKAVDALKELSEKEYTTADRKAFALRAFHEVNQPEFFDPAYGDYFAWTEDAEYGGSDIESAADQIELEDYQLVQLTRVVHVPDVFVVAIPNAEGDIEYEVFDTEEEAEARANAAEEAALAAG